MKLSPLEVCTQNRNILGGFDNARWIGEAIEAGLDFDDLTYNLLPEASSLVNQLAKNFTPYR